MRGWTSDFTPYATPARVTVTFLPPDFDFAAMDRYRDAPLAPEIVECESCDPRACHALIRTEGRTVKPDCAAFLALDAAPAPTRRALKLTPEQIRAAVRAALTAGPALTLAEIMAATGLKYDTARKYVAELTRAGELAWVGVRDMAHAGGQQKEYALTRSEGDHV